LLKKITEQQKLKLIRIGSMRAKIRWPFNCMHSIDGKKGDVRRREGY
jgi:hypothetical protein